MDKPVGDFVKYHRSLLEWEWYHDLPVRVLFLHLMLDVNWKPGRFEGHDIPPGSVPTSIDKLSAKSGLTRQSVRTALDKLKSTGEITIQATSRFSVVTLANWEKYQSIGKQLTRGSTHQSTGVQHASNTRSTSIEEGKKERSEEENVARAVPVDPKIGFIAACKAVVDADPTRLPEALRKEFFDYWTETDVKGRMRFQGQDYFDHGRRMDTWRKRAEKSGDIRLTNPPVVLNANGKPQQLKPWVN